MRLVYLSPVPWASFAQRPQKFVEWFHARTQGAVLWIDPYPTRLPVLSDFRRGKVGSGLKMLVPDWLTVLSPKVLPIEPLPASGQVNGRLWISTLNEINRFVSRGDDCLIGIGKPSELAMQVLKKNPCCDSLYDAMDDFPAFYSGLSRWSMRRKELAIAEEVNSILVSSSALQLRFKIYASKVMKALNACAMDMLPPPSVRVAASSPPILGYVGTIGQWFDWAMICDIARQNSSCIVRLIGPVYQRPPMALPDNLEILPPCDHVAAIKAMQEFSVGLIPFRLTELTASVDPIKYYEYRAIGLPVLSTPFGEMVLRRGDSGVFLVGQGDAIQAAVVEALNYKSSLTEVEEFRKVNSWESRFDPCGILA